MVDLDVVLDVGVGLSMLDAVRTGPKNLKCIGLVCVRRVHTSLTPVSTPMRALIGSAAGQVMAGRPWPSSDQARCES